MRSCYLRIISFVVLVGATAASTAATPPVSPLDPHPWHKLSLKVKPTSGIKMGSLHVEFEKTTLDDVRRAAAKGEISQQGDAGDSIYWLCYTSLLPSHVERIWVISHGEIGGSQHSVTSFRAQIFPNGKATTDCPELPTSLMPLSLDNNLWLNSTERAALNIFGVAAYQNQSWRSYYYHDKKLDSSSWLWVKTLKGRVTSLHAGQVTGF